jgi:hypothetical protein
MRKALIALLVLLTFGPFQCRPAYNARFLSRFNQRDHRPLRQATEHAEVRVARATARSGIPRPRLRARMPRPYLLSDFLSNYLADFQVAPRPPPAA